MISQARLPVAAVRLRDLTGHDERLVDGTDTQTAIELLDQICVWRNPRAEPEAGRGAIGLTAHQRDLLLAAVYQRNYGPRIQSTVVCPACGKPFDLQFPLPELLDSIRAESAAAGVERLEDQTFRTADRLHFRMPTGEDELAVESLSNDEAEQELLRRLVLENPNQIDSQAVEQALSAVMKIVDLELDTECAECRTKQQLHFDLQSFVLRTIAQGRTQLWLETNMLAATYHWSLDQVLGLSRSDRRTIVSIIEAEQSRRMVR